MLLLNVQTVLEAFFYFNRTESKCLCRTETLFQEEQHFPHIQKSHLLARQFTYRGKFYSPGDDITLQS